MCRVHGKDRIDRLGLGQDVDDAYRSLERWRHDAVVELCRYIDAAVGNAIVERRRRCEAGVAPFRRLADDDTVQRQR